MVLILLSMIMCMLNILLVMENDSVNVDADVDSQKVLKPKYLDSYIQDF